MAPARTIQKDMDQRFFSWLTWGVQSARVAIPILLLISYCDVMWGQSRKPTEYQVKAAYLYNFGKFVRWPAVSGDSTYDSFLICVLGNDPFGSTLDSTVEGESLDGKHLKVRRMTSANEAVRCHILYISSSEEHDLEHLLSELTTHPVLTVSDIPDFVERGGDIEFVNQGDRIRFKVNLASAEKSGLVFSSDLLKVAIAVKRDGHSGD